MKNKKIISKFPESIIESCLIALFFVVFSGGVSIVLSKILFPTINNDFLLLVSYLSAFFLLMLLIRKINKKPFKFYFNFRINNLKNIGLLLIATIIVFIVPFIKLSESYFSTETIESQNPFESVIFLFGGLIIAPVIEEVIFRGIILDGLLSNRKGFKWKAIIISSFLFAIIHINPAQVFVAFIIGLFIGLSYSKKRNLLSCIILHFIANLLITIANYFNYKYGNSNIENINDFYGKYSSIIFIISIFLIIFLISKNKLWNNFNTN